MKVHSTWLDKYFRGDRVIWLIVFILSLFSLLAVYSSTGTLAYKYQQGNTSYYVLKHLGILLLGLALMYGASLVRYTLYSRISQIALVLAVPLLFITLLTGTNINEARRWLTLPVINLSFQTSDFAKLALIMYVARTLSTNQENIKNFKSAFVPIIIPVLLVCVLILPANLSTAALLFMTCMFLMFIGRINMKYIGYMAAIGIVFLSLFIGSALIAKKIRGDKPAETRIEKLTERASTWIARVQDFSNENEERNYQTQQAKIAVASGGILGKMPGNSSQRNFLPHPYSDFIYAIIIEEYGFIGAFLILFLYILLFYRVIKFVTQNPRAFGTLLAIGCTFMLIFQALINMAVATNMFPVTGQPLPLISMGGTSLWFTSISIGIILSISRDVEKEPENKNDKEEDEEDIKRKVKNAA